MKKTRMLFIVTSMILYLFLHNTSTFATKYVELSPEEVNKRATVIVTGTYDFSSKPKSREFIFQGYEFNVSKVFKGEATKKIIAGIDMNDTGWADEFQKDGGQFLLFLEKSKEVDFLVPVGGPNGMIHISNGEVKNEDESKKLFYEKILNGISNEPNEGGDKIETETQGWAFSIIMIVIVPILLLAGFLFLKRKQST